MHLNANADTDTAVFDDLMFALLQNLILAYIIMAYIKGLTTLLSSYEFLIQ